MKLSIDKARPTTAPVLLGLALAGLVAITACSPSHVREDRDPAAAAAGADEAGAGAGAGAGSRGTATGDACDLTTALAIQQVVGGRVSPGVPGHARDCQYRVSGGAVSSVAVFRYGTAAEFGGIKAGYEANRGPLEDLTGIGTAAFSPGDVGRNEIVVEAGDTVFAVGINALSAHPVTPEVKHLAAAMAAQLG